MANHVQFARKHFKEDVRLLKMERIIVYHDCHDIVRWRLLLLCHRCDAYARSQCCSPPDSDASRCCASLQHFLFSAATLLLTSQPILQKNDISVHGLVILCTIQAEVGVETYQKYRDGSKSFWLKKCQRQHQFQISVVYDVVAHDRSCFVLPVRGQENIV